MKWMLSALIVVLVIGVLTPGVGYGTKVPATSVGELRIYESSSNTFGANPPAKCQITTPGDAAMDYCDGVEQEKTYRVEIRLGETEGNDGTFNYIKYPMGALVEGGGSVDISSANCRYDTAASPSGTGTALNNCDFSGGVITFADSGVTVVGGGQIWVWTIFTTGTQFVGALTSFSGDLSGVIDSSDVIAVGSAPYVETYGNETYGWAQVVTNVTSRLTMSADRQYYDYGYKPIQIYARVEDYWAQDCGWWYISDQRGVATITIKDGKGEEVASWTTPGVSKGRVQVEHTWTSTDDPGKWNITIQDNTSDANFASIFLYVRGQLNVTTITNSSNPTSGSQVTIYANITDHNGNKVNGSAVDNAGTSIPPNVTAYVTGAGDNLVVELFDNGGDPDADIDGEWTGQFTPTSPGDHKIIVKASDGHRYWVDGRGSMWLYVTGNFPYASLGLTFFEFLQIPGISWGKVGLASLLAGFVAVIFIKKKGVLGG